METLRFLMVSTFYPPYHLGGDAVHVQYLAEALAERGHEVHVEFSPAAFRVKRLRSAPAAAEAGGLVHLHPLSRPSQLSSPAAAYLLGNSPAVGRRHARAVREIRPDVIHLHNISLLGLSVQAAPGACPLLYTAHDYWFRCPRSDLLKRGSAPCDTPSCLSCMIRSRRIPPLWRGTEVAPRMDRVQAVIAPSRFMKGLAETSFRCPVIHIPNFVPDGNPRGEVEPGSPYYLYVGVLERHKGLTDLAEAARRSLGTRRFILVGQGSLGPWLRSLANAGVPLEVHSGITREALSSLLKHAGAFLMPSIWYENAPLAAIEALSWGSPLLGTSLGGIPELMCGGTAGRAFPPGVEGILRALRSFEDSSDPGALRRGARQAYEAHHTPGPYLARYLSLLKKLLGGEDLRTEEDVQEPNPSPEGSTLEELPVAHGHHDP